LDLKTIEVQEVEVTNKGCGTDEIDTLTNEVVKKDKQSIFVGENSDET